MQAAGYEALAVFLADLPGVASVRVLELQALEGQAFVDRGAEVIEERFHGIDDTLGSLHHRAGGAVGHDDLHGLQIVVGGVLEVLHGLHLVLHREVRRRLGGGPYQKQLAEQHVALVDTGTDERVQVHHAQLDVADALF